DLFLRQTELAAFLIVRDITTCSLRTQPFAQITLICFRLGCKLCRSHRLRRTDRRRRSACPCPKPESVQYSPKICAITNLRFKFFRPRLPSTIAFPTERRGRAAIPFN